MCVCVCVCVCSDAIYIVGSRADHTSQFIRECMCECVCVCMNLCMCIFVCTYVNMYVYMYVCLYVYFYIHAYIYRYVCAYNTNVCIQNIAMLTHIRKNGGHYSIGFWVKPIGDESMLTGDTFNPQIAFFGQISPPLPQLQFAKTAMGTSISHSLFPFLVRCVVHMSVYLYV